jgi:hypothetical protein
LNCFVLQTSGGRGKTNTGASAGCGGVPNRCCESEDAREAERMYLVASTRYLTPGAESLQSDCLTTYRQSLPISRRAAYVSRSDAHVHADSPCSINLHARRHSHCGARRTRVPKCEWAFRVSAMSPCATIAALVTLQRLGTRGGHPSHRGLSRCIRMPGRGAFGPPPVSFIFRPRVATAAVSDLSLYTNCFQAVEYLRV